MSNFTEASWTWQVVLSSGDIREAEVHFSNDPERKNSYFEDNLIKGARFLRMKVPGGWIVQWSRHLLAKRGEDLKLKSVEFSLSTDLGPFFYPDPNHEWDGGSLD